MWGFLTVCVVLVATGWALQSYTATAMMRAVRESYDAWIALERHRVNATATNARYHLEIEHRRVSIDEALLHEREDAKKPAPAMPPIPPYILSIKESWQDEWVRDEMTRVIETTWRTTQNWDAVAHALAGYVERAA